MTDWSAYQKCPHCFADLGEPCLQVSGYDADSGAVAVEADGPHGNRKLRAGSGRAGGRRA